MKSLNFFNFVPLRNFFVFLIAFIVLAFVNYMGYGQTGPGGVGTSDGTSNLELWLDANTITGLSDGDNVTSWDDASGNGLAAVSSGTTTEEPTYDANTVNLIFPSISFDGTDDFLNLGNPGSLNFIPGTHSWTFFIVYNTPAGTPQGTFFAKCTNLGPRQYQYTIDDDSGTSRFTSYIGGPGVVGSITSTGAWFVSSHTNNTTNRDSWTNEGVNFATTIGNNLDTDVDILIGARRELSDNTGEGFHLMGSIAEIAMYSTEVNTAERIIITNYLAAKYDIALTDNDVYVQDVVANGNYDFEVAGIGRVDASNIHDDAQGTGIVRILNPGNLGDDEFLMWGHDNGERFATETTDVPAGVEARFDRVWRVSELDASGAPTANVGNIDIRFDLTGFGAITASDLRLLVDVDNDATFADETPISGAALVSGSIYEFSGVAAIADNLRFTLGTADASQTPLPIELISFSAKVINFKTVQLEWQTASETDNDYFTLERSADGTTWEEFKEVSGAGNSNVQINYTAIDPYPYRGMSYYRLKQTDYDGQFAYSEIVVVEMKELQSGQINIYPNPGNSLITIEANRSELTIMKIYDVFGREVSPSIRVVDRAETMRIIDISNLPDGVYTIMTSTLATKFVKE